MRKKILLVPAVFAGMALFSLNAYAGTMINQIHVAYDPPSDSVLSGYNEPGYTLYDAGGYWLSGFECLKDESDITGKKAVSYEMTLQAENGYEFARNISAQVDGAESVSKVSSIGDELKIRFKAYPYVRAATPSFATKFDEVKGSKGDEYEGRGKTVEIEKNGASSIEYLIEYVDQDGEIREKHGKTSKAYLDVSDFNGKYAGTKTDKHSSYIRGIAIRAIGNLNGGKNIAPSEWVYIEGGRTDLDVDDYFDDDVDWDDLLSGRTSVGSSNVYSASGPSIGSTTNTFSWSGSGDNWRYLCNGNVVKGWVHDGTGWYFCDTVTGQMKAGWYKDTDGRWYHLHTVHDGFFGRMDTGWYEENGLKYYFAPEVGAPEGSMTVGSRIINGIQRYFAEDGHMVY